MTIHLDKINGFGGSGGGGGTTGKIKILNVVENGTVTREGTKYSGFANDKYLQIGNKVDGDIIALSNEIKDFGAMIKTANSFECVFLCNYKTKTKQYLFGESGSWASKIGIENVDVVLQLNFEGGESLEWLIIERGSYTFTENADYYFKFAFDGTAYTLSIKEKNETSYTTVITIANSTKFSSGREWIIGYTDTADTNNEWGSYIDMEGCSTKSNGDFWWKGVEEINATGDIDLPSYLKKPTIVTDGDASNLAVAGNTIYDFMGGSALTSLTISSVENSYYESYIIFKTGAGTITLSVPNTLRWGGGEAPTLEANTVYCIAICSGLAEIDSFGSAS